MMNTLHAGGSSVPTETPRASARYSFKGSMAVSSCGTTVAHEPSTRTVTTPSIVSTRTAPAVT